MQVCLRGYTVFKGYYKDQMTTDEAIDKDGCGIYHPLNFDSCLISLFDGADTKGACIVIRLHGA